MEWGAFSNLDDSTVAVACFGRVWDFFYEEFECFFVWQLLRRYMTVLMGKSPVFSGQGEHNIYRVPKNITFINCPALTRALPMLFTFVRNQIFPKLHTDVKGNLIFFTTVFLEIIKFLFDISQITRMNNRFCVTVL